MQAAVVPAVNGTWEVKEVPTPEPGVNEVLIKIHASGLCYTDVHITKGEIPVRPDGRLVVMGYSPDEKLEVPGEILFNRARIIGSQQNGSEYLYEALDYVAKGKVKVITETYSLNDISRVYERVAEGKVRFRAVIALFLPQ